MVPDLTTMLGAADAALIIGDPALRIEPATTGLHVLDLGEEWFRHTGLPMVFAMWSGPKPNPELAALLEASYEYGRARIPEIVAAEAASRNIDAALADSYLRHNIVYRLDDDARRGLRLYLETATKMEAALAA
jgi:predicted solute-binding protein